VRSLGAFEGWQQGDRRWSQVARLRLTAEALLPLQDVQALEVPALAASLEAGPVEARVCKAVQGGDDEDDPAAANSQESDTRIGHKIGHLTELLALERVVDKDTRLYEAASGLVKFSEDLWQTTLQPACAWTIDAVQLQLKASALVQRMELLNFPFKQEVVDVRMQEVEALDVNFASPCSKDDSDWILLGASAGLTVNCEGSPGSDSSKSTQKPRITVNVMLRTATITAVLL